MSAEMRSDSTIGIASPARWAATSSSVKNGLPCPRAKIASTRAGARGSTEEIGDPAGDLVPVEAGRGGSGARQGAG